MPQPIAHRDLFHLLALELPHRPAALQERLARDPASAEALAGEAASSPWGCLEPALAAPLRLPGSATPLLTRGARLTRSHLGSLLARQARAPEAPLGPVYLEAAEPVVAHYRRKVIEALDGVVESLGQGTPDDVQALHRAIREKPELAFAPGLLREIVVQIADADGGLSPLLEILGVPESLARVRSSCDVAVIAMAVMWLHTENADPEARHKRVRRVGVAAVFQDVSLLLDPSTPVGEHPERSAKVARGFGVGPGAAAAIANHHRTADERGDPVLRSQIAMDPASRVLATVNVFLGLVAEAGRGKGFAAMKGLNFLAFREYVDRRAVEILSALCLPRSRAFILERAGRIAAECPVPDGKPILWPVAGDKVPTIFLCSCRECPRLSSQVTQVAQVISIAAQGREFGKIAKGEYYACTLLTPRLRELYEVIQGRGRAAAAQGAPPQAPPPEAGPKA